MVVSKNILRKLTSPELENYLREGNRFVPEAVQMAFEILQERGRIFSEEEKISVQQIIEEKKQLEEDKRTEEHAIWDDYITNDPDALKLFPRSLILIISLILGTIPGAVLLGINLIKVKKYFPAVLTFIFGIAFLFLQNFLVPFLYESSSRDFFSFKKSPEFLISGFGAFILFIFWVIFMPKKLPYQAASYVFPVVISVLMFVIILMNENWFSHYFIVIFAK